MDTVMKQKWVDALRSGKYKQGRRLLKNRDNEFCCLGVLCDLEDNTKWEKYKTQIGPCYKWGYSVGLLPPLIGDKYKISNYHVEKLVSLNDNAHYSFNEIADYIEENL